MRSQVQITNLALTLLGDSRIVTINDTTKQAREALAVFDMTRDALLGGYNWNFAMVRAQLTSTGVPPVFEFSNAFNIPADCLRLVMIGDYYAGLDMTDYRGTPTEDYAIESGQILAYFDSPMNVKYVRQITDTTKFDANFDDLLAAELAVRLCEPLTQSKSKRDSAENAAKKALMLAIRANAIQLPPKHLADDEWMISRL